MAKTNLVSSALEQFKGLKTQILSSQKALLAEMRQHIEAVNKIRGALQASGYDMKGLEGILNKKPTTVIKQRKTRVSLNEDAILKFIGKEEKTAGDVEKHFGCSYITAMKKLGAMKGLKFRKDGLKKLYSVK